MDGQKDTGFEAIMEHLIEHGANDMASVFAGAFELAMRIERERFLGAAHYQRTTTRQGYANGTKPKRIDTPAGTVTVQVCQSAFKTDPQSASKINPPGQPFRAVGIFV